MLKKEELKSIMKQWSVLFVDDESFVVETMQELLPFLFKEAFFATNGIEGLEKFKNNKIDLVITDISMPKMNGIDMAKQIQQLNSKMKIICISGHNEKDLLAPMKEITQHIIIKPISTTTLYDTISKIVND